MAHAALTYSAVSRYWSIQDVTSWLSQEGFAKYAQIFQDSYIDGRKLLELDDLYMKDRMKIPSGDRRKLLERLNILKSQLVDDNDHGAPATPDNDFSDGEEGHMDENNDGDDLEYEVPPDDDSDGDVCYSEPDDELKPQKRPGFSLAQQAKPVLPQKTAPMVKPPALVPKPAVNPKPSPTSWTKPKAADADFVQSSSPSSSPVAPPARPPKTAKALQVSGPGRDFVPEPNASASRQHDKAASDRVSRSDSSAVSRPLPSAPAFKAQGIGLVSSVQPLPPKLQVPVKGSEVSANDDEDDEDADDYLEPGEPDDDLPGPIQLPEAVSATRGKKSSLDKVDNPQPTRPDVRGRGFVPPALDKKAPSRTPSASTGTSAARAESRSSPLKSNGASPFGKPLPPTPPTELPTVLLQQPKRPSISTTKFGSSSESHLSKGNGDVDKTQNAANEEEEEEEEEEEDEEEENAKSSSGSIRKGLRSGSHKLRNLVHDIGQHLASKFKEKPKKTPDETETPGEAEQNSNESFNSSSGSAKLGQRPPARLPAPGVKPPATGPPPLPAKPGPNHTDAADAASESGSGSGSILHRGRLPQLPSVSSGRESKAPPPMLPNPFSRLKTVAEPPPLEKQSWFKSSMDRKEAIAYLQGLNKDGAFVVRNSSKGPDSNEPYSLSAYYKRVYHLLIRRKPNNRFALGTEKPDELTFATVLEMIEHHKKNPINLSSADGQEAATTVLTTV